MDQVISLTEKTYWKILTDDIFPKKSLTFLIVLTTVACFGFAITNFSIGVDDAARDYYLYSSNYGNMIQQGRLLHVILNLLTRSVQFIPFFSDFVGAVLFALSALLYCALFQYISGNRLSLSALISFSCVYISHSIIAEKYIYDLDVIVTMLSYCCSAIALMYAYRFVKEKKCLLFWKAAVVLVVAVGSYESFIFLYFCGVFSVFILEIAVNQENKSFRSILQEGIRYALILLSALVFYYGLVVLIQLATNQYGIFHRYSIWDSFPLEMGFWQIVFSLTSEFYNFFLESIAEHSLPILIFCLFSFVGAGLCAFLSFRMKNIWLFVCYMALWIGNFVIQYAAGSFMARAAQTFCFFIGFVLLLLIETFGIQTICKRALILVVGLLVFVQSVDMNHRFYNDYVRYKKEEYVINTLATRLVTGYDLSKPVVFIDTQGSGYLDTVLYPGNQVNGKSVLYWSANAFNDKTQPFVSELFRMHGYDFILSPTVEQFDQAYQEAESMPQWPHEDCIKEFEEFIVINFD